MSHDKQLSGISVRALHKKQQLDQALNAKEFAILAGVSYSTAREWLHLPGFPALRGLVFWQDFVLWRRSHAHLGTISAILPTSSTARAAQPHNGEAVLTSGHRPERALRIPHNGR